MGSMFREYWVMVASQVTRIAIPYPPWLWYCLPGEGISLA